MSKVIRTDAHTKGRSVLAFTRDGRHVFTGGYDTLVRIWKADQGAEDEPAVAPDTDEPVTAVASADDCWLSASVDGEIRRYSRNTTQLEGILTTSTLTPRSIAIDPNGRKVAVASDDPFVKVVDIEDMLKIDRLEGYTSGVRSATWHPSGTLLATCTSDGKIIIWNMAGEKPVIEKTIEGIIPAVRDTDSPEFAYDCSVVWHTSGEYFFVATKGHELITITRGDWTKNATFTDKSVTGSITALALSSNGTYIASASQSRINIWSTQTRRLICSQLGNPGSTITQVAFSPRDNLIAWTDADGAFSRWPKPISDNFPDPVKKSIATNGSASITIKPKTGLDLFGNDDDDSIPVDKDDDDPTVDLDDDMGDIDDGWIVDDMDGAHSAAADVRRPANDGYVKEMVSITQAQPPFQPGSTPMDNKKRYLAYNMIGVIDVTDQDTHNILNVEFHDRSLRTGYHLTDNFKYDLGYLGERGAVFACPPENDHSAEVYFKPYGNTKAHDWTYTLSKKGVKCLGVAAGALPFSNRNSPEVELQGFGHVVIATTENDLTFLSGTGRERRIMALGGDFVTMVAGAEWVFVVHRAGSTTIDGSQNLSYSIINFEDFTVRQRDVLPVPKGHTLKWVGLTDQGAPAIYDSTGYVHILTKYRIPHHASWARVMDTNTLERRQGKDESYWPVGITESNFMCLILKGRQEYPSFPKPLIQELPMRIPFRHVSAQEEAFERETLHVQMSLDSLDEELTTDAIVTREKAMDRELVQLIQGACKAGNTSRAIELTKLLHHIPVLDAAMKIADFYHLSGLKEKMAMIKANREEEEDRLVIARNKRRRWLKPDAPLREVAVPSYSSSSRFDPLADDRPPPVIERPGMARVTVPRIEKTRYSSSLPQPAPTPESSGWDDFSFSESPASESKRKRTEMDESISSSEVSMPPPKQKTNPFARKVPPLPSLPNKNKNPWARKVDSSKTIQKSESFFDKVDAAESETAPRKRPTNGKSKEKKEGPKQATSFGMMTKTDKQSRQATPKTKTEAPNLKIEAVGEETQIDSQMTDVFMSEDMGNQLEETQPASPDWDETQMEETFEESGTVVASEV